MALTRGAALLLATALLIAAGADAAVIKVDKCEPSSEGCYPSKASLIALSPKPGKGQAPPRILALWARQSLCTSAQSENACAAVDGTSSCYWDSSQAVCFSTIKAPEAVACPESWVEDFVLCDFLEENDCKAASRCVWGKMADETLCYSRVGAKADPPFPDWGTYQRITFSDPAKLGDCPAANEYRKFHGQCWGSKAPDVCEKNKLCLWNPFAGCNIRAFVNAAFVTGNNTKIAEAYKKCNAIKDPKECVKQGTIGFDPAIARALLATSR